MDDRIEADEQAPAVVDEAVEAAGDGGASEVKPKGRRGQKAAADVVASQEATLPDREEARAEVVEAIAVTDAISPSDLASGAAGPAVERLQAALGLEPSGKYDRLTANAVRRFQSGIGLTPTGRVDLVTFRALGI